MAKQETQDVFIKVSVAVNGEHYQPDDKEPVTLSAEDARFLIVRNKAVPVETDAPEKGAESEKAGKSEKDGK